MKITAITIASLAVFTQAAYHKAAQEGCITGENGVQPADWRIVGLGCNCPRDYKYVEEKGCVFVEPSSISEITPISTKTPTKVYTPSLTYETHEHYEPSTVTPVINRCTVGDNGVVAADFLDVTGKCLCPATFEYSEEKGCIPEEASIIEVPTPDCIVGENGVQAAYWPAEDKCECPASFEYKDAEGCVKVEVVISEKTTKETSSKHHYGY